MTSRRTRGESVGRTIRLGPFELDKPIGRGGMGEVWRGVHVEQHVPVAIKVIAAEKARQARYRATFQKEVHAVATLNHPGIVAIWDYGEISAAAAEASDGALNTGSPYLAMELLNGASLQEVAYPLGWPELKAVLLTLLDALAHAHARSVIHRDIKPSNVLVDGAVFSPYRVKLTDFGIAHALAEHTTQLAERDDIPMGTPLYMPPEQLRGSWRDYGPWTDLYAFGCMAFEMVATAPPFKGNPRHVAIAKLVRPAPRLTVPTGYPKAFGDWVDRLLAQDPRERFQRSADAAWALRQLKGPSQLGPFSAPWLLSETTDATLVQPTARTSPSGFDEGDAVVGEPSDPIDVNSGAIPPLPLTWRRSDSSPASGWLTGTGLGLFGLRLVPLADRELERDLIWDRLCQVAQTKRPQFVILRGPAGAGKSRLASWTLERAHEVGGATTLSVFHGPAWGPNDGIAGMVARLYRCFGLERAEILERLELVLRTEGVDDDYEWRALTKLVEQSDHTNGAQEPNAITFERPSQRYVLVQRLLERVTRSRPAIVWLDDVQWGSDSLGCVEFLLNQHAHQPLPVLLLATARDEALAERALETQVLGDLLKRSNASQIDVAPLLAADQRTLVGELLGFEGPLVDRLTARTGGNPLFAVQLVGDWVRRGILEAGPKGFVLNSDAHIELPDGLHMVWSARIEKLLKEAAPIAASRDRESARQAMELAAVLGQTVDPAEWVAVCAQAGIRPPPELTELLINSCLAKPTEEGGWCFVHGMLRESLERQTRESGRWEAHNSTCATFLERDGNRSQPGFSERLGRHWVEAGELDKALAPLEQAIRACIDTSDFRPARRLLDYRDRVLRQLQPTEDTRQWCANWLFRLEVCRQSGHLDESRTWAVRTEQVAAERGWPDVRTEALMRLGEAEYLRGNIETGRASVSRALAIAETLDDPGLRGRCAYVLGIITRDLGLLDDGAAYLDRGIAIGCAAGDDALLGRCLAGLGSIHYAKGRTEEATALYGEALDKCRQLGVQIGVATCLNGLANVARQAGRLKDAEAGYRQAAAICRAIGSINEHVAMSNVGRILLARAKYHEAQILFEAIRREIGRSSERNWADVDLALCCCAAYQGQWNVVEQKLDAAIALLQETGFVSTDEVSLLLLAGDLALASEQSTIATTAYQAALSILKVLDLPIEVQRVEQRLAAIDTAQPPLTLREEVD